MTLIPENPVTQEEMAQWYVMRQELGKLKSAEMLLRKRIFRHFFPDPKEGTNTFVLPDHHQLKGKHVINRKIDEPALTTLKPRFLEEKIPVDALVVYKPDLSISTYRTLTEEQRKLFDQALIIDLGSPDLEIASFLPNVKEKLVRVTILADASHCPDTLVAGYGYWIVSERGRKPGGGPFKEKVPNAFHAEMMAICNARCMTV